MVPTLSSAWNVFLIIGVLICGVIAVVSIRSETRVRNEVQKNASATPPVSLDDTR